MEKTANYKRYEGMKDKDEFNSVKLSKSLFDKLVEPACFNVWNMTDTDIVFQNDIEWTYRCMIAYKKVFNHLKTLE